ncbi:MAG: site-specific DNA-methyltransferase, partial [Dehalococcoidia bacterium]
MTELIWEGKYDEQGRRRPVERIALPFQVVETINQSRATREQAPLLAQGGASPAASGWTNKLIWGDNQYVLASLLQGDPSTGLEPLAGKVDIIYIDPPFGTEQDFSYRARVGDEEWLKEASVIEETAYRDTWGRGLDSYLHMLYERLVLMRELLADTGSIYVHVDYGVAHYVKLLLDEIFGADKFQNEIVWQRTSARSDSHTYNHIHDTILFYTKSEQFTYTQQFTVYDEEYVEKFYHHVESETGRRFTSSDLMAAGTRKGSSGMPWRGIDPNDRGNHWKYTIEKLEELDREGRIYRPPDGGVPRYKRYLDEMRGLALQSIWSDVKPVAAHAYERLGFDTQKPEALLERIIKASSCEGDLVADFFCGSGTTMAVAEKLGRRWTGCDLSRYAIQVSRKRLLDTQDCQPFEVLNLGRYERRYWQVNILNGPQEDGSKAITDYLRFIVALYHAEPAGGYAHLHG